MPSLRNRLLSFAAVIALGGAAGCVRNEAHDAGDPLRQTVRVNLTFTRIGQGQGLRFEAQAHFARFAASEADRVGALLGVPDDESIPLDACRSIDRAEELDRALAGGPAPVAVRLLDAGRLAVRGGGDAIALVPKHYPELTPYVAGVMYGNEDQLPIALSPGAAYEVSGEGGEAVGPFTAQVQAPRAFASLDVPVYRRGGDLELRWPDAGEVTGPAVLTVAWSSRGAAREVRCRVRDDGAFTVPRDLLEGMPPQSQLASAEVSFIRARRAAIQAPGASPGEVVLGLREVVPLPVVTLPAAVAVPATPPPAQNVLPPNPPVEGER